MKTRAVKKREAEDAIAESKRVKTVDDLTSIERLPNELFWKVLDCVPEAVPNMLQVSRGMRIRVENYAKDAMRIPLADKLRLHWETRKLIPHGLLLIKIDVPNERSKLFELRMRLLHGSTSLPNLSKIVKSNWLKTSVYYKFTFETMEKDAAILDFVNGILGKCISTSVELCEESDNPPPFPFAAAALIVNAIHSPLLKIQAKMENSALCLLNAAFVSNIGEIELNINRNHAISDPKALLKLLSTHVQSMIIHQSIWNNRDTRTFGIPSFEWPPLVLELFSNKMDKLKIINTDNTGYLNQHETDFLRECLPKLNKKIFFKTSTNAYPTELDYTLNEYSVKTSVDYGCLFINHTSRTNERDFSVYN